MPTLLKGDAQCFSIPGVRGGALLGLSSWGRGRGAGSRPSGSHAGLFLSQRSCYQSPFQRSRYGASPALSAESLLDASRGTGSQSGPASLQKGPVGGKGDKGMEDSSLQLRLECSFEMQAHLLGHRAEERTVQHRGPNDSVTAPIRSSLG